MDSDRIAHEVFRPGHALQKKIGRLFGMSGRLGRMDLARQVFSDPGKRKKLEAVVHPYVRRRIHSELKRVKSRIVILEVPLLFESGFDRLCGATVSVAAGREKILNRLRRLGVSTEQARARFQAQLSEREKCRRADFLVLNTGSKEELVRNTKRVWRALLSILERRAANK
jgi:dephospho-CoA kinase